MRTFIFALLLFLMLTSPCIAQGKTISISSSDWAPWTGKNLPHGGFVNHVVVEAFKRAGYTATVSFYPWPRAYELAVHGEVEASSFWYKNKARQEECFYSDPINKEEVVFFHLRGKLFPKWNDLMDLKNMSFAVNTGVTYTDEFWALSHRGFLKFHKSNTHEENFAKLLLGRVDAFPASKIMGLAVLKEHFTTEEQRHVVCAEKPLTVCNGYLIFGKETPESPKLVEAFNKGLKKLRKEGTYESLYQDLLNGEYDPE